MPGNRRRSGWSEGREPRGTRASKARVGRRTGKACHRRWSAYGKPQGKGGRSGSPRSHHLNCAMLRTAFFALKRDAAAGVDGVRWQDYEADLDRRIEDLSDRVHRGAYRAQPSRRRYIPKPDGRQRPLAVAALEDKIVQRATTALLNAIYEEEFLGFSYGFRPGRGQHDALDALHVGIDSRKVNHILDADIAGFFDAVSQDWLIRFVEHRIDDPRIIRLIRKWLKAGVLEDGVVTTSERGTGQGSVISPLLANIYLHYVFDLWADRWG